MNTLRLFGGLGTLLAAALLSVASIWLPDGLAAAATDTDPWVFVSSPDWFNRDIADLSGNTLPVPGAPGWAGGASGGINGVTPEMRAVYSQLVGEMAACGPCAFLVAGDLINGHWFTPETLDMFAPGSRNRAEAIDTAASIYYRWYVRLLEDYGIAPVIAAPGDHEIGDDPWAAGTDKAAHVETMKRAFARELVEPVHAPEPFPGIPALPPETDGFFASFAFRIRNVLFVSIDMFDWLAPGESPDLWTGTIRMRVDGAHLAWLAQIFAAADADRSLDHVIVQGHLPVIDPVRMHTTSGLMLSGRQDSPLWQLMRQHDQRNGGKVRMYFAGEVHTPTVVQDPAGDIVQIVHGNPPTYTADSPAGNYLVFTVHPKRIDVELRRFELYGDGSNLFWQPGTFSGVLVTAGPSATSGGRTEGLLTIDTDGPAVSLSGSGWLTPVPFDSLLLNYQFDELTLDGEYSNGGDFGNLYYTGKPAGAARTGTGKFGDGLVLDGNDAFVTSGRGQLIEGETRTVGAWVKLTAGGVNTIVSYGGRKSGLNGRFLFRINNGRLELDIAPYTVCVPASVPTVSDGQWHHVAVVLPNEHDNRCSDLRFYVDGNGAFVGTGQAALRTLPWTDYRIGVDERASSGFFDGAIDDLAIWHAPLSTGQVRGLVEAGNHPELEFDALAMQSLYSLYYRQSGTENLGGREWRFVSELAGVPGDVMGSGDDFAIQFDGLGNGVGTGDDFLPDAYVDGEIFEPAGTVDLSAEGSADWLHGGLSSATSINRKAGVPAQISGPAFIGGSAGRFDSTARLGYRWDDGTPVSSATVYSGLYTSGIGNGFQVTVPADSSQREVVVYVGGSLAEGRLEASLGDQGAAPFVIEMSDSDDVFDRRVKIAYRTKTACSLTVRYTMVGGTGNVTFSAVTLQGESVNQVPVIDALDAHSATIGETLSVAVVAHDHDGPPPLVLTATAVPAGAHFTDQGSGSGLFSWTPGPEDVASVPYEVIIEATDAADGRGTASLFITVLDATEPFVQDSESGIVSIEAEHYDANTDRGGHAWVPSSQPGASGSASLVTTPNNSTNRNVGYETDSPRLDYQVNFLQPGTYKVWLRGLGASILDDSAHFGVNGSGPSTADRISPFPAWWRWSNQTMDGVPATIAIPAAGEYTLNLWMREDGFIVDKIVLAPAASGYNPTADGSYGPPESLRTTPQPGLQFSDETLFFSAVDGGAPPAAQTIDLAASDGSAAAYALDWSAPWLTLTPAAGNTPATGITVAVDPTGMLPGTYTELVQATAPGFVAASLEVRLTITTASSAFQQDGATGLVSMEAEHYDANTDRGGHAWVPSSQPGASGSASLVTTPNNSTNRNVGYETDSPRLDYQVNFLQPGTYKVWLRGLGASILDDSAHFGVNGSGPSTADRISPFPAWWRWSNQTMDGVPATIAIPAAGEYTLNLWMREDGFIVDKIVLAPAASGYNPTADGSYGPPESLRTTPQPGLQFSDETLFFSAVDGGAPPAAQTIDLAASDGSAAAYALDWSAPWLTLTPAAGNTPATGITVAVDPTGMLPGTYTELVQATAPGFVAASLEVRLTITTASSAFQQDGATGLVSMEAEHYDANTDRGGHAWVPSSQPGASGSASLVTTPNNSTNRNVGYETDSPRLDYQVNFLQPGTYKVWLRGLGASILDDSAHFGVNGSGPSTADRISPFPAWWRWSNQTMDGVPATIAIPAAGEYTLNLWMREDGFIVDKIVLAPAASGYNPTADGSYGPPESLRTTPQPGLQFSDETLFFSAVDGGAPPAAQTIDLAASDGSAAAYALDWSAPWLTLTPAAGNTPATGITVAVDPTGMLPGTYTELVQATAPGFVAASLEVRLTITTASSAFQQDGATGLVSMEAEHYDANTDRGGHAWVPSSQPGASGSASLVTTPNNSTNRNVGYETDSPRLDYQVNFLQPGTYKVWLRGLGASILDDSAHFGVNGSGPSTADRISPFPAWWRWSNQTMDGVPATIAIPAAGEYTLNLWMREDGFIVDKIVLAPAASGYNPTADGSYGPPESLRGTP